METILINRKVKIIEERYFFCDKDDYRGGQIGTIVSVYSNQFGMSCYTVLFRDNKMKDFNNRDLELV